MDSLKEQIRRLKFRIKYLAYINICIIDEAFCFFSKKKKASAKVRRKAYIFSCPDHGNAGDIAIEKAQIALLDKNGYDVTTINVRCFLKNFIAVKKELSPDDLICVQGGGSFGGLYPQADLERLLVFRLFKNNKIISFPQTICVTNDMFIKRYVRILKKRKNIILFFREKASYKKAIDSFSFMKEKIKLVPDIVLSLKDESYRKQKRTNQITLSLRRDKEKGITNQEEQSLIDVLTKEHHELIKKIDTYEEIHRDLTKKEAALNKVLNEYSKSRLVITDRLHGMILAYITNTPCIAISNSNGKVKDEYETWLSKSGFIKYVDTYNCEDIMKAIADLNSVDNGESIIEENIMPIIKELQ